jgi:hypothetical protein
MQWSTRGADKLNAGILALTYIGTLHRIRHPLKHADSQTPPLNSRSMFAAFFNTTYFRAAVWSLVVALLLPSFPARGCDCSAAPATRCCCAMDQQPAPTSSCCPVKSKQPPRAQASCCRSNEDSGDSHLDSPCRCGLACRCEVSRTTHPQPVSPRVPNSEPTQRAQPIPAMSSVNAFTLTIAVKLACTSQAEETTSPTSLDRCISLSRFTC